MLIGYVCLFAASIIILFNAELLFECGNNGGSELKATDSLAFVQKGERRQQIPSSAVRISAAMQAHYKIGTIFSPLSLLFFPFLYLILPRFIPFTPPLFILHL